MQVAGAARVCALKAREQVPWSVNFCLLPIENRICDKAWLLNVASPSFLKTFDR